MARTAELILRLVDQVTAPARAITGALGMVDRAARGISNSARNTRRAAADTAGLSIPILAIGSQAAQQVYAYEKAGNAFQAVTNASAEERVKLEQLVEQLNTEFPATNVDIMEAAVELGRSGMEVEQIYGSLRNVLNLALAGDFGIPDSSAVLIATATSMRLAMGTNLEAAEATARTADAIAFAANESLADIPDVGVTFRYVAAAAAATGMSIEELAAITAVFAQNGIMGSSAGTGLRYGLLQLLNPTKAASAALARLNIDIGDYVTGARQVRATDLIENLGMSGIHVSQALIPQIESALNDPAIMKSPAKLTSAISQIIMGSIEDGDFIDGEALAGALNDSLAVLGTQIDVPALLDAFRQNPDSEALFGAIFGKQHAVKWMALLAGDLNSTIEKGQKEMEGSADRNSRARLLGVVGSWTQLTASVENFYQMLGRSGLVEDAMAAMTTITQMMTDLGNTNPEILRLGSYALLALAGLAPLGWAIAGVQASVALLVSPIGIVAASLGYLAYLNWDQLNYFFISFKRFFNDTLDPAAVKPLTDMVENIKAAFSGVSEGFSGIMSGKAAGEALANFANGIPAFVEQIKSLDIDVRPVLEYLNPIIDSWVGHITAWTGALGAITLASWDGIIQGIKNFQDGLDPETVATFRRLAGDIQWLATALGNLSKAMAGEARADAPWYENALAGLGTDAAKTFNTTAREIEGIRTTITNITAALPGMWSGWEVSWQWTVMSVRLSFLEFMLWLRQTAESIDLAAAGAQIMQSLWDGMVSKAAPFLEWVRNLGNSVAAAVSGATGGLVVPTGNGSIAPAGGSPNAAANAGAGFGAGVIKPQARAGGGAYGPGLMITGEKGAELQMATGRGHVFNADETKDILSGKSGGGGGGNTNIFHITGANADEIAHKVAAILDQQSRSKLQRSRSLSMEGRPSFG